MKIQNFLTIKKNINSLSRWEQKDKMLSLLKEGKTIIIDRYAFSGAAFSAAKEVRLNFF